jgi:hypothetical protein
VKCNKNGVKRVAMMIVQESRDRNSMAESRHLEIKMNQEWTKERRMLNAYCLKCSETKKERRILCSN